MSSRERSDTRMPALAGLPAPSAGVRRSAAGGRTCPHVRSGGVLLGAQPCGRRAVGRPRSAKTATAIATQAMTTRYQAGASRLPVRSMRNVDTYGAVVPNSVTVMLWANADAVYRISTGNWLLVSVAPSVAATPRHTPHIACPRIAAATLPCRMSMKPGTTVSAMPSAAANPTIQGGYRSINTPPRSAPPARMATAARLAPNAPAESMPTTVFR